MYNMLLFNKDIIARNRTYKLKINQKDKIMEGKSLKDQAAEKLGLDPKTSSIKDVQAAMLGLDPKTSSLYDVEMAMLKLGKDERDAVKMLQV